MYSPNDLAMGTFLAMGVIKEVNKVFQITLIYASTCLVKSDYRDVLPNAEVQYMDQAYDVLQKKNDYSYKGDIISKCCSCNK